MFCRISGGTLHNGERWIIIAVQREEAGGRSDVAAGDFMVHECRYSARLRNYSLNGFLRVGFRRQENKADSVYRSTAAFSLRRR
jgi:hypothetical protein